MNTGGAVVVRIRDHSRAAVTARDTAATSANFLATRAALARAEGENYPWELDKLPHALLDPERASKCLRPVCRLCASGFVFFAL